MIPVEIVTFLEGAAVGFAGTRNRDLIPSVHRVSGWIVGPDRLTMTCLISKPFLKGLVSSLEENGQFAITVTGSTTGPHRSNPPRPATDAHEAYQFKGNYLSSRSITDDDLGVFKLVQERFVKLFSAMLGVTEEIAGKLIIKPDLAVTFRVNEVYVQTPGPNAGKRIVPSEDK